MGETNKYTDLSYLREMSGNDTDIIREMIEIFIEQVSEFESEISAHFNSRDWGSLGAIAHKAKSSVRTMGMEQLGDSLEQLEHLSKGNCKLELQLKKDKGQAWNEMEEKCWFNVKNESIDDIELKEIPDLIDTFFDQCPKAIDELKQNMSEL